MQMDDATNTFHSRITDARVIVWSNQMALLSYHNVEITSDETKFYSFFVQASNLVVIELNAATGAKLREFEV